MRRWLPVVGPTPRAARRGARIRCRSWTRWYAALCYCCTTTSSLAKLLFGQVPREHVVTLMLTAHPELLGEKNLGDIFEFGVFTGGGLRAWIRELRKHSVSFTGQLWGFDSFVGLPDIDQRTTDREEQQILRKRGAYKEVAPGALNALKRFQDEVFSGVQSVGALQRKLRELIGHAPEKTHFIAGFFNESLPSLPHATRLRMRPAFLVDFDGDYYSSTIGPWEFLLANCLVVPGTFVYYDDLQQCGIGSGCGEGRAHAEVTAKYGIVWERHDWRDSRRHNRTTLPVLFRVLSLRQALHCTLQRPASTTYMEARIQG